MTAVLIYFSVNKFLCWPKYTLHPAECNVSLGIILQQKACHHVVMCGVGGAVTSFVCIRGIVGVLLYSLATTCGYTYSLVHYLGGLE